MSSTHDHREASVEDAIESAHSTDSSEYQTLRGCLGMTAVTLLTAAIILTWILVSGTFAE